MENGKVRYSIIVPLYNEEQVISETCTRIQQTAESLGEPYEILFINDGSSDNSRKILEHLCAKEKRVKLINFSRNFGHQCAISAGMDYAAGDAVVIIDADLQDPPEVIPEMVQKWKEGFEVVYGKRTGREGEGPFKKVTAAVFYRFLRLMTDVDIPSDVGDFRLIDRKVCDAMKRMKERNRFVRGLVTWAGFKQTAVEYIRQERLAGETKYPFHKMMSFALDAVVSFSFKPLRIATFLGFFSSLIGFGYLVYVLYLKLFTQRTVAGWSSLISINLIFFGIILIILGIIGEYIGRIYDESKMRPLYIIESSIGIDTKKTVRT